VVLSLQADFPEVHLWLVGADPLDEGLRTSYLALLSKNERTRYDRITHPGVKRDFLLARALVRTTLSRYDTRQAHAWSFEENEYGYPFINPSQNPSSLRFNLSHTQGLMVLAVSRHGELGVDVENVRRRTETTKIAHRYFASPEVDALKRLPEAMQKERFFAYWTLKEAYIKARGMGLSIPLRQFWFDLDTTMAIGFDNAERLNDPPSPWRFAMLRPTPVHPVSVALKSQTEERILIRVWDVFPLKTPPIPLNLSVTRTSR
jgi:4'-phosphopantetheinyl transferase